MLLLPPSPQCVVELHQRQPFIALGLCQAELGIEVACVAVKHFKITGGATAIANICQSSCILRGRVEQLLLLPEFLILTVSNQRVRDFAESLLDGLLVSENCFLLLCLSQSYVGADSSSGENGLKQLAAERSISQRVQ